MTETLEAIPENSVAAVRSLLDCIDVKATGSRVICPQCAGMGSDHDFIAFVADLSAARAALYAHTFTHGGSVDEGEELKPGVKFVSMKRAQLNIIVTADRKFFDDFVLATTVATRLGLVLKCQRVTLFQAILYGNSLG